MTELVTKRMSFELDVKDHRLLVIYHFDDQPRLLWIVIFRGDQGFGDGVGVLRVHRLGRKDGHLVPSRGSAGFSADGTNDVKIWYLPPTSILPRGSCLDAFPLLASGCNMTVPVLKGWLPCVTVPPTGTRSSSEEPQPVSAINDAAKNKKALWCFWGFIMFKSRRRLLLRPPRSSRGTGRSAGRYHH